MNPRVAQLTPTQDHRLELVFTNGEVGVYDCRPLLDFGVFKELKDLSYFTKAQLQHGTVVWPNEQDICPDTLYMDAKRATNG